MPSAYKDKQPKPITKQGDRPLQKEYPVCTNCGKKCSLLDPQFSKCYCGGTYQLFGVK